MGMPAVAYCAEGLLSATTLHEFAHRRRLWITILTIHDVAMHVAASCIVLFIALIQLERLYQWPGLLPCC